MPSVVKDLMLSELRKQFEANQYAFISSFDQLSVADLSDFRRKLEKVSQKSVVVKHTLAKKIFDEMSLGNAANLLKGQVVVTLGDRDPQNIAKELVAFTKGNKNVNASGVIFEKNVYDGAFIEQLSKLPTRHEILTQLVVRVKSPISGMVMTLGAVIRGLVNVVNEVKKQRESAPQPA